MKKIFLSNGNFTLVSDEDHLYLAGYNWSFDTTGYVRGWIDGKVQHMHRVIVKRMGLILENKEIDHINLNKLDNRRENLRTVTRQQNSANSHSCAKSGLKGVTKCKNKWMAQITVNYEHIHLGLFDTPEEASDAYCKAAKHYFGEFARSE